MKRIWIAFALLGVVAALGAGALWQQKTVTDRLIAACDELIVLYEQGDIEACHAAAEKLSENLEEETRLFPFFLRHERMEDIFYDASTLPYIIRDNDPADFMSAVASMRMQLEVLLDNEWPVPENVL